MGEYWVTQAKKQDAEIDEVKALMNTVEGLTNPVWYDRDKILESLEKGDKWYTCYLKEKKGSKNIWEKKSEIYPVNINGETFIRIDEHNKKRDNLGEIPKE